MAQGVTMLNLSNTALADLVITVPSLPEQRRIVDILDRVANIRRLRRQARETARQIIPALFAKMFGDPAANPMGWPVSCLGNLDVSLVEARRPKPNRRIGTAISLGCRQRI